MVGINRIAITIIKENCSTGTPILDRGASSFSRPYAKSSGLVVNVNTEANKMSNIIRQTKRNPVRSPSSVTSIKDQDQRIVPLVNTALYRRVNNKTNNNGRSPRQKK
ncbi:hypothetical protein D3C78_1149990 [compost metagenome]